jgi:type IV pilus assembly protein PilC
MPAFTFTARDAAGRTQNGELTAETSGALVNELRGRGWIVLDVQTASAPPGAGFLSKLSPGYWLPPAKVDVEIGFQQLSSMLRSGLTLLSAIKTTAEQARRASMTRIWERVYERIEEGSSFANALAEHPKCFPDFVVQLVHVGEESGTLELVLTRAATQLERARNLKVQVFNAMMYPAIVLLLALGVTSFMLISLIPKLQKFLAMRHKTLPAMTQALLTMSDAAQVSLPYVAVLAPFAILAGIAFYRWPTGRMACDRFALRIPIVGKILRVAATASFARTLGLLLQSGVSLLSALTTVERLMSNRLIAAHIEDVRETVMQGGTLAAPLLQRRIFMAMVPRMVAVGETTGSLDPVLDEVANFHEKELAATIRRLSVLIEPAIIVLVGGIVGFVYIAFFVALYSLAG